MKAQPMQRISWVGAVAMLICTGCVFQDVRTQQSKMETFCRIDGSVSAGQATNPVLVGLVRHDGGDLENRANWSLVDHFVLESPGRWMFRAGPGTYGLVAFVDLNADGVYQPGEPFMPVDTNELVTCDSRHTHSELALFITAEGRSRSRRRDRFHEISGSYGERAIESQPRRNDSLRSGDHVRGPAFQGRTRDQQPVAAI